MVGATVCEKGVRVGVGHSGSSSGHGISSWITAVSSLAILILRPFLIYTPCARRMSRSFQMGSSLHLSNSSFVKCWKSLAYASDRSSFFHPNSLYLSIRQ